MFKYDKNHVFQKMTKKSCRVITNKEEYLIKIKILHFCLIKTDKFECLQSKKIYFILHVFI